MYQSALVVEANKEFYYYGTIVLLSRLEAENELIWPFVSTANHCISS